MLVLSRFILILGGAAAACIWIYEWWRSGLFNWHAIPFHQLLSNTRLLPRGTYLWAYCSTQSPEARAGVEFCADVSTSAQTLGRAVWFYLGTEAGMIVAANTMVLAAIVAMFGGRRSGVVHRRLPEAWPESQPEREPTNES